MEEYTKSPWLVDGDKHAMNLDIVGPEGRIAMIDCENFQITDEELAANARLIATAPDMLDALEKVQDWLAGCSTIQTVQEYVTYAIAKAKGN